MGPRVDHLSSKVGSSLVWSQGLKVSRSQGLKVSRSQGLKVSRRRVKMSHRINREQGNLMGSSDDKLGS